MNYLTIINHEGTNVTDSREVANMTGKRHAHLMRDIQGYISVLDPNPNLDSAKFFIESSYKDTNNQERPCYLLTKQGCEMVANKMTGQKGVLFTAEYVQAFNKMENVISNNMPIDLGLANQMINLAQGTQVIGQVVQGLMTTIGGIKEYVQDSIQAKDKQIDDIANMVGLRTKNTRALTDKLKLTIQDRFGIRLVNSNMEVYKKAKSKIFKEFKVYKWEEIPVTKCNAVEAFIENMFD